MRCIIREKSAENYRKIERIGTGYSPTRLGGRRIRQMQWSARHFLLAVYVRRVNDGFGAVNCLLWKLLR